jgi:predicted PurR-regulated permease PerM
MAETQWIPTDAHRQQRMEQAERQAAARWRRLGMVVRSITPSGLARFVLVIGAALVLGWLVVSTWPALLPFVIGAAIAYAVLPVVNMLAAVMPRLLAAVLVTLALIAALVLLVIIILRPLAVELASAFQALPGPQDIRGLIGSLNVVLAAWPPPVQDFVRTALQHVLQPIRSSFGQVVAALAGIVIAALLGLVNLVAVILGLFVLPIWLLVVLRDERKAISAIDRGLPAWLRADFWAVVRICDRVLGIFLRGLALQGFAVGALTFVGLRLLPRAGFPSIHYPLALAALAAVLELIPMVGPLVAAVPAVALGLSHSPQMAIAVAGLYIIVQLIVNNLIASHVQQRIINVHPAVLVMVIVAISQFGVLWILLAAPIAALVRDLFRYTYGRFGDPPRPAGLLPGEVAPLQIAAAAPTAIPAQSATPQGMAPQGMAPQGMAPQAATPRVPLVYRRTLELQQPPVTK